MTEELKDIDSFLNELNILETNNSNEKPNKNLNKQQNTNESVDLPNWWVNPITLTSQPEITPIQPKNNFNVDKILENLNLKYLNFDNNDQYNNNNNNNGNSIDSNNNDYLVWPRQINTDNWNYKLLIERELSIPCSTVELVIDKIHYQISITNYREVFINTDINSSNSTSLDRPWSQSPAGTSKDYFHRGNTSNLPFLPGGVKPSMQSNLTTIGELRDKFDWVQFWHSKSLLTTPPGLDNGILDFTKSLQEQQEEAGNEDDDTVSFNYTLKDLEKEIEQQLKLEENEENQSIESQDSDLNEEDEVDESIANQDQVGEINEKQDIDNLIDVEKDNTKQQPEEEEKEDSKGSAERQWGFEDKKEILSPLSDLIANPAIEYPFELDSFQKQAILHMEQGDSVFITAHTSAGKTVIAEYAIAMAAKNMTRAIYTSPIKALSNQKFRDFKNTFNDVGLITGDVSISPASSCLVLTTEILRSMLYKGADLIRDIEWVIFDEVHYLNDLERGVVWEEVIIMLPPYVKMVFLSATVSNPLEFANWIGRTKQIPIYVIGTTKRPIPLEHYIHTPSNEMFKIVDSTRKFLPGGYNDAFNSLYKNNSNKPNQRGGGGGARQGGSNNNSSGWSKLITTLKDKQQLPVIIFSFSKNKCQEYASSLGSTINLTQSNEKSQIRQFIEQSLGRLCEDDKTLPQILQMRELLERGIGVHHGGLLPIVKELVEILFSKSLVKVLFATETFAMGVNMPAKTVVYSNTRKHDGITFRDLLPGEYTQMSGRAGRRGLDKVGTVIITYWKDIPEQATIESMLLGTPSRLNSQFRLTYNMILNLLRVPDFKVEDMIKRSFSEFSSQQEIPDIEKQISKLTEQYKSLGEIECILGEPDIENYYSLFSQSKNINERIQKTILNLPNSNHFSPGRVLVLSNDDEMKYNSYTIGVIIQCNTEIIKQYTNNQVNRTFKIFSLKSSSNNAFEGHQITISNGSDIKKVCDEKIKVDIKLIESADPIATNSLEQQLQRIIEEYPLPLGPKAIDPIHQLKLKDVNFVTTYEHLEKIEKLIPQSKCHKCPRLAEHYELTEKKHQLQEAIRDYKYTASDENLKLMPQFNIRLDILKELGYIDQDNSVTLKGRVSREINTCEELVPTELIFENAFISLEPSEVVSVLSCLIFQEKDALEPILTPRLDEARKKLIEIATKTYQVESKNGLDVSPEEKLETTLKFGLMQVVYEWARGTPFNDICKLTNVLEGSIVRAITRIGETCQEVRNAARVIGDTKLLQKMEEAIKLIKRDIVYTSSLYVN
ncbi:hypothetical protein DICPUDRAFT_152207 [Dictyostelium purpureum]|uniref:DEAD/DEAH box helicase n=1 Tax=Dictyostelium purpureum TaxID=5786 RepID=F0ZKR3_DICPU|nr:uncharacterized protein DICPUDRAFT_152207 [Dictyostelium purpureum]EGC35475.1 hypothetical protein DICPUDRAFT_152207 [Dictyostelium purpureum]|eukprot:XP_003288018.1 hypothetical protein DICPUDRAFT_152207 [Dictyostelium purpureum]